MWQSVNLPILFQILTVVGKKYIIHWPAILIMNFMNYKLSTDDRKIQFSTVCENYVGTVLVKLRS